MGSPTQLLIFNTILGLIFVAMDVYVLRRWSKFTVKHSFRPIWRRLPWAFSVAFLIVYSFFSYKRYSGGLNGTDALLFGLVSLWFFPKLAIVITLMLKDISVGAARVAQWIGSGRSWQDSRSLKPTEATSRRAFLEKASWTAASVPFIMAGNGMARTLYDYRVIAVDIDMPSLPRSMDGMKSVQVSDIHAGSYLDHKPFQEAMRLIDLQQPDMIVMTGDFVNTKAHELSVIARDVAKLKAPYGVFGSLGNHEHYNTAKEHQDVKNAIREVGIDLIVNDHRRIGHGEASLVLAATDNTGFRQNFADIDAALDRVAPGEPTILLAHDPTFWDKQIVNKAPVDLMLSGHTHGGQFGVSLMGFEWSPAQLMYEQWAGLYRKGDQQIYVNRGLGTVGPPIRIGIRPEITVFTLRSRSPSDNLA